eukprot:162295_1
MTVAKYNGNDRDTIFISNDTNWVFGFQNNKTNIVSHDGSVMRTSSNGTSQTTDGLWIINIDSPKLFRSQQETLYENINDTYHRTHHNTTTHDINWGINIFNSSDWAVATVILFNYQLSVPQAECVERMIINKYNLEPLNNKASDNINHTRNITHNAKIYECDRWSESTDNYIVNWYDVNSGFNGSTLFDLSGNSNHISIDENIKVGVHKNDFRYLYGSQNSILHIPNAFYVKPYFTAIHYVARFNGNNRGSILVDAASKFYCGFYRGKSGICYSNDVKLTDESESGYDDQWLLSSIYVNNYYVWYCAQNCETFFIEDKAKLFSDVTLNLTINGEYNTEWALTEIIIVKMDYRPYGFVPFTDSMCIEKYLSNKYNINSYQYNNKNIFALPFLNFTGIILILIGGIFANYLLYYGFLRKMISDMILQILQSCCFACYCCCGDCCTRFWCGFCYCGKCCCCSCCCCRCYSGIWCCTFCCRCFQFFCMCRNCCCGALKGIFFRHICACQISILPIYNVLSAVSSFTSSINRFINSRNELAPFFLLNGACAFLGTAIHFTHTYEYIFGNMTSDGYSFFYFVEITVVMFLWSIQILDSI